jgi:hypothetical protein
MRKLSTPLSSLEAEAGAVVAVSLPGDARQGPRRPDPTRAGEAPAGRPRPPPPPADLPRSAAELPRSGVGGLDPVGWGFLRGGSPSIQRWRARSGGVGLPPRRELQSSSTAAALDP